MRANGVTSLIVAAGERLGSLGVGFENMMRFWVSFPCKMANVKKMFALEIRFARRPEARLPYPTLTGGHQVCITRKGVLALRLLTNRGQENHLFASSVSPTEAHLEKR